MMRNHLNRKVQGIALGFSHVRYFLDRKPATCCTEHTEDASAKQG